MLGHLRAVLAARRPPVLRGRARARSAEASETAAAETKREQPLDRSTLYVVSTPIGNLEDITLRALRVLRLVDAVLAEDTRHSRQLLTHFGLRTPLVSLHAHNEEARAAAVTHRLAAGEALALVSDAGTPALSDPGALLVAAVLRAGHKVVAVPGASALLAALVCSGLPTHSVSFAGFLPPQPGARRRRLLELAAQQSGATLAFYLPPHKAAATLADAAVALGAERRCCVARELTKLHEEVWRGSLAEAATEFGKEDEDECCWMLP
jgi:16S rRNA (cytidine1402-2'-O)-methyltransferase